MTTRSYSSLMLNVCVFIYSLMSAKRCGCLLVADNDKLVGIFTDGDLRRAIEQDGIGNINTDDDVSMDVREREREIYICV
jgi:CBS domain-containing protein